MSSIPIAYCGASAALTERISQLIAPKYEVVHIVNTFDTAMSELPALLRGERPKPASGLGSQSGALPVALVIGGAFTNEMTQKIKDACDVVKKIPFFKKDPTGLSGPPSPEVLAKGSVETLDAKLEEAMQDPRIILW